MKLTGAGRQTGGQDHILSQADTLTKNRINSKVRHHWFSKIYRVCVGGWVVVAVNAPPPSQYAAPEKHHLEQQIKTLWSTPWSTKNKSYGALCFSSKIDINNNNNMAPLMTIIIWCQISSTWSTPYGLKK